MRNGTVEPAVLVVGGENASLGVVPPFLQKRQGVVGEGNDVLQAVWANGIRCVLCGCVRGLQSEKGGRKSGREGLSWQRKVMDLVWRRN